MQSLDTEPSREATEQGKEARAAAIQAFALGLLETRKEAIEAIRALRYGGNEYFWINDMKPVMVMHPIKPELEGKDLSENKDPAGLRLFVEFVNVVKANGAGFVMYLWPKPGSDTPVPKVSYVEGFEPWGWIIGSGVYVDNVRTTIASRVARAGAGTAGGTAPACCPWSGGIWSGRSRC